MMNRLNFKDCINTLGKSHQAKDMKQWYTSKDYTKIVAYIQEEAYDFINSFSVIYAEMPKLKSTLEHFNSNHSHQNVNYNITYINN